MARLPVARKVPAVKNSGVVKTILVARKVPDMKKHDSEDTSGSMNKLTVARKCFKNTGSEKTYGSENTSAIMNKFPVARKVPAVEKTNRKHAFVKTLPASLLDFR
jgi:hypothetical protein